MEIEEAGSSANPIKRERNENQAEVGSGVKNAETGKAWLYKAAIDGNFDAFKDAKSVAQLVTPNRNSVLHIYITAKLLPRDERDITANFLEMFLAQFLPSQLLLTIFSKRTLHLIATRHGQSANFAPETYESKTIRWALNFARKILPLNLLLSPIVRLISFTRHGHRLALSEATDLAPSEATDRPVNFVQQIVELCPDLLWTTNIRGETPLHIAARHGHSDIVEALISQCKNFVRNDQEKRAGKVEEMLEMPNKAKDTALHEAVRWNHVDIVQKLVTEGPDIRYGANEAGESVLYLAAASGFEEALNAILTYCKLLVPCGPRGRTALHGAVLCKSEGITNLLLVNEKTKTLTKKADERGWIPLHYAAYFGYLPIVERLLEADNSSVATRTKYGDKTALHLAASSGKVEVLKTLISLYPDCCELVDERGLNVIHFAVESKNEETVKYVLDKPLLRNLLYQRNAKGYTPLHQLVGSSFDLFVTSSIRHPEFNKVAFTGESLNDLDIILVTEDRTWQSSEVKRRQQIIVEKDEAGEGIPLVTATGDGGQEGYKRDNKAAEDDDGEVNAKQGKDKYKNAIKDASEAQLVVATLIATVTFAAGFTMPGGFIGNDKPDAGGAVLIKQPAFQVFVITDTIALMLSCSAALIHLLMHVKVNKGKQSTSFMELVGFVLTFYAMLFMLAAFIAGIYAVLAASRSLSISTCVIGSILFFTFGISLPMDLISASPIGISASPIRISEVLF